LAGHCGRRFIRRESFSFAPSGARYVDEGHTQQLRVKGKSWQKFKRPKIWHDDSQAAESLVFNRRCGMQRLRRRNLHGASALRARLRAATAGSGELATASSVHKAGRGARPAELNRVDKMRKWLIIVPLAMPVYLLLVRGLIFRWLEWAGITRFSGTVCGVDAFTFAS